MLGCGGVAAVLLVLLARAASRGSLCSAVPVRETAPPPTAAGAPHGARHLLLQRRQRAPAGNATAGLDHLFNESLERIEQTVERANWTLVYTTLRDPSNRGYLVGMSILAGLWFCLFGYRCLRIWLFLGGFLSIAALFWMFAPGMFDTQECCGPGTERARLLISFALGIAGGTVALFVLKIGVFLTGSCLGLALSLVVRATLDGFHVAPDDTSFALVYLMSAVVGGLLSLYKEKPIIVLITAVGGAFVVCCGMAFFVDCDFITVVEYVEDEMTHKTPQLNLSLDKCNRILSVVWLLLSVFGVYFQFQVPGDNKGSGSGRSGSARDGSSASASNRVSTEYIVLRDVMSKSSRRGSRRKKSSYRGRRAREERDRTQSRPLPRGKTRSARTSRRLLRTLAQHRSASSSMSEDETMF